MAGIVDYWCNVFTPDREEGWRAAIEAQGVPVRVRVGDDGFADPAAMVERMDRLGIDTVVVPVAEPHEGDGPLDFSRLAAGSVEEVGALVAAHPGRVVGCWSYDPAGGMAAVDRAREALELPWVVGLHLHTHSFDRPLDHADHYPFYALAADAGVPVVMQAGTSGGLMPSECGRPIGIDRPALYFRGVDFVLSHTGWPWVDEAVAMALKHPHVHLGTAVYPQRHWDEAVRRFLRGPGRAKTLYGTGFPTTGHRHTLDQLGELELPDEVLAAYLGGTARRVFSRLPGSVSSGDAPAV